MILYRPVCKELLAFIIDASGYRLAAQRLKALVIILSTNMAHLIISTVLT